MNKNFSVKLMIKEKYNKNHKLFFLKVKEKVEEKQKTKKMK